MSILLGGCGYGYIRYAAYSIRHTAYSIQHKKLKAGG